MATPQTPERDSREKVTALPPVRWTAWEPLPQLSRIPPRILAEILDGGQAFRWLALDIARGEVVTDWRQLREEALGQLVWDGVWSRHRTRLRLGSEGGVEASFPLERVSVDNQLLEERDEKNVHMASHKHALACYLNLERDFAGLTDQLPWRSDGHLRQTIGAFPGLRLLRQPYGETLLAFLMSSTKRVPQIREILERLAIRFGEPFSSTERSLGMGESQLVPCESPLVPDEGLPIPGESSLVPRESQLVSGEQPLGSGELLGREGFGVFDALAHRHRLPTWAELAEVPEVSLRECGMGYRARYLAATAQFLKERPGWLEEVEALPYAEGKAALTELPGVGAKIADCVLLFGAGHLEAFPVDTWILKCLQRHYQLDGWKPDQVAHFGRMHFGPAAGLAQQYLFAWERASR